MEGGCAWDLVEGEDRLIYIGFTKSQWRQIVNTLDADCYKKIKAKINKEVL